MTLAGRLLGKAGRNSNPDHDVGCQQRDRNDLHMGGGISSADQRIHDDAPREIHKAPPADAGFEMDQLSFVGRAGLIYITNCAVRLPIA
jgi:hypothetical protein